MNIWLALDKVESKNAEDILAKIRQIEELNSKSYVYYFKSYTFANWYRSKIYML